MRFNVASGRGVVGVTSTGLRALTWDTPTGPFWHHNPSHLHCMTVVLCILLLAWQGTQLNCFTALPKLFSRDLQVYQCIRTNLSRSPSGFAKLTVCTLVHVPLTYGSFSYTPFWVTGMYGIWSVCYVAVLVTLWNFIAAEHGRYMDWWKTEVSNAEYLVHLVCMRALWWMARDV